MPTTESKSSGGEKAQLLERIARERAAADRERSGSRPPQQPAPRRSKRLQTSRLTPVLVILLYVATSAANLKEEWWSTWCGCCGFWFPFMCASFSLIPPQRRVQAQNVANLVWTVVIDYIAHRSQPAAAA